MQHTNVTSLRLIKLNCRINNNRTDANTLSCTVIGIVVRRCECAILLREEGIRIIGRITVDSETERNVLRYGRSLTIKSCD